MKGRKGIYTTLIVVVLFMALTPICGQEPHRSFYQHSLKINNTGMMVLGSWALANIAIGAYGWNQYSGRQQYFHQMNLFWNSVNLAIAGFALYSNYTSDFAGWGPEQIMTKQMKTQQLFLINAGLDVVYMGAGILLKRIAVKYPKNESRLIGYGDSVILQGAFLFVFDLVMYGIQRAHRLDFLQTLSLKPVEGALALSLTMNL